MHDTDVCPGGPPGYVDLDLSTAPDPLAACAAACCGWLPCTAWIVRNFSGTDGDLFLFQVGGPAGQNYWCNAVSSGECFQGKSAVPVYYSYASSQFASAEGKQIIGVAAANGVPEPAAWSLMLAGFAGLGVMLRRRVARASI